MSDVGEAAGLLQLAAQQSGGSYPPLPPPRPKDPPAKRKPNLQWQWEQPRPDYGPGHAEWESQGPTEGQADPETADPRTSEPGYDEGEFFKRLWLMHALATQYGWNI